MGKDFHQRIYVGINLPIFAILVKVMCITHNLYIALLHGEKAYGLNFCQWFRFTKLENILFWR